MGVLSIESGAFQSAGLSPAHLQLGLSYNHSRLEIMSKYYPLVDTSLVIQSLVMSAGLGVTRRLSLWAQIPRIQSSAEGDWEIGAPAIGFRWRPVARSPSFAIFRAAGKCTRRSDLISITGSVGCGRSQVPCQPTAPSRPMTSNISWSTSANRSRLGISSLTWMI